MLSLTPAPALLPALLPAPADAELRETLNAMQAKYARMVHTAESETMQLRRSLFDLVDVSRGCSCQPALEGSPLPAVLWES